MSFTFNNKQIIVEDNILSIFTKIKENNNITLTGESDEEITIILEKVRWFATKTEDERIKLANPAKWSEKESDWYEKSDIAMMELKKIVNILNISNELGIEFLSEITAYTVAKKIKSHTIEEMRQALQIDNDFTPEEEAELSKEHEWLS